MNTILNDHLWNSYKGLRRTMILIGLVLPLFLYFGGMLQNQPLQSSMSAYYLQGGFLRDVFVGTLFTVGFCLIAYKGYTPAENWILNFAGIFAIGVALFPVGESTWVGTVHGSCAIALFLCIAGVCLFCADDTLALIRKPGVVRRYRLYYLGCGILMILSPLVAFLLMVVFNQDNSYTFFAEISGIWTFALYWSIKSQELESTWHDLENRRERLAKQM